MRYLISLKEEPMKREQPASTRFVQADTVHYSTLVSPVVAPGRFASAAELDLVSEASGRIIKTAIPLKKGAQFKKGDLLFTIYPDEAEMALKARKSQFLTLLVNLIPDIRRDYPDFEEPFITFYGAIDLDSDLPALPDTEDQALTNFLASRLVLSEYYGLRKDELSLSRRHMYAPFDGTYSEVYIEAGAYINTGGRVAHAIQTDKLEIEVPLERFHSRFVSIGDEVSITSDTRSVSWRGQVVRKSQFVDPGTQSQSVFVQVNNQSSNPILAGEYLSATFAGQAVDDVMEVKRNAVFNSNEVFIVINNHLEKKVIDIVKVNEQTVLFRGLEKGSLIVNQPLINVMEGTAVAIIGDPNAQIGQKSQRKGRSSKPGVDAKDSDRKPNKEDSKRNKANK